MLLTVTALAKLNGQRKRKGKKRKKERKKEQVKGSLRNNLSGMTEQQDLARKVCKWT